MSKAGRFWKTVGGRMVARSVSLGAGLGVLAGGAVSVLLFGWWAGLWAVGIGLAGGLVLGLLLGLLNGLALGAATCRWFFPPGDPGRYRRVMGVLSVLLSLGGDAGLGWLCREDYSFPGAWIAVCAVPFVAPAAWWASGRMAEWYCGLQE